MSRSVRGRRAVRIGFCCLVAAGLVAGFASCSQQHPAALPDGHVGLAYEAPVPGAGRSTSWAVVVGQLPPGLKLEPRTGLVRGTPQHEGQYAFTAATREDATSPSDRLPLTLHILATASAAATTWQGTDDYRLFQHVPAGNQISTAHVTLALTAAAGSTLTGTADGSVDAVLELSNCPSRTVTPARFHAELTGTRTNASMELHVVNPSYSPIDITPCPTGGKPGVIGGGKILYLDEALKTLTSTDGQTYRFHAETTYPSGMYPYTVTHTIEVHR
jgi:putative Ig domain-containing protein